MGIRNLKEGQILSWDTRLERERMCVQAGAGGGGKYGDGDV